MKRPHTHNDTDARPAMLLLSHCVPSPFGDSHRARAWQLLRLAARSHRVSLVCAVDDRVNLDLWRSIHQHVEHLILETSHTLESLAHSRTGPTRGSAVSELLCRDFHAVMLTHPSLWNLASGIDTPLRICDLDHTCHRQADLSASALSRWLNQSKALRHRQSEERAIRESDLITVSTPQHTDIIQSGRGRTLLLPHGIDPDFFTERESLHDNAKPRLVIHADWTRPHNRKRTDDLLRRLWPQIHRHVPGAQIVVTPAAMTPDTRQTLDSASVVLSPDPDPSHARWPILQAMAMRRAVVAPRAAAQSIGARDGEHLFAPSREEQWVDQCIRSLKDARLRLDMATAGRYFVERHCMIDRVGAHLSAALLDHHTPAAVLRKAA